MTALDRSFYDQLDQVAAETERRLSAGLATERPVVFGLNAPPPCVRINLKRLASGEWQPDYSVESFDADPATDAGYDLIKRRLEDTDSLVRQRIKQFADRDAGVLDDRD